MKCQHYHIAIFAIAIIAMLLVMPASAAIFSIGDEQATISIKTISSFGNISKDSIDEKDLKTDTHQTIQVQLSKIGKTPEIKYIQLYPQSRVIFSSDFEGNANVMQISSKPGYPQLEVHYGYQKSRDEPWQYYFRVEKVDTNKASVIYADFSKKSVWLGDISRSRYDTIITDGKIPEWDGVR